MDQVMYWVLERRELKETGMINSPVKTERDTGGGEIISDKGQEK